MGDPKDEVERLLAAPDSVKKNAAEKAKYLRRKAEEQQERERRLAMKSGEIPSIEDIIADVQHVASDPDKNPLGHTTKSLSGPRYEQFGRYPLEHIQKQFGNWQHVMEVAGLRDQRGTKLKLSGRAEQSRRDHAKRYIERYVRPYAVGRDLLDARTLTDTRVVLSISDTHSTFLDPFTWQCFLASIRDMQLGEDDIVLLNGDHLEGGEISRFPKIPGWNVSIQVEFDFLREMVRQIRATGFKGRIILVGGNHGIDRWAAFMTQVAPALLELRDLRIDRLMGLDEFDVELAQGGKIMSPIGTEEDAPGLLLFGFYRIHHGVKLGQFPAGAELKAAGRPGQSGHTHRAQLAYGNSEALRGMSWMSTPMGCSPIAGRAYMKGTEFGWQKGFGIAFLSPGGKVHQYPVVTDGDLCHVEGFTYERIPDLADPDPSVNWLPDLPVLEHV